LAEKLFIAVLYTAVLFDKFMFIKITYFVHETTMDNEKEISSGWSDVGLSDLGRKQSIELKDKIKDKKFDVVFCSDLKRAVDSAKLTFEGVAPILIQNFVLASCRKMI
jgi:alpha-ribazole phosphatase/probable phosphoglycerate mutase